MKIKNNHPGVCLMPLLFSVFAAFMLSSCSENNIVLENRFFRYEVDRLGKNLHFTDKTSGTDYLSAEKNSLCASVIKNGTEYGVTGVSRKGSTLFLDFKDAGVAATIKVRKERDRIILKVTEVKGEPESLTFVNIPLRLEGMPYEPFAACALSMNLFTRVRELPALQSNLWATSYNKFGLTGAEVTIVAVPQKDILPLIRDVMSKANDVPFSDKGGAWIKGDGNGQLLNIRLESPKHLAHGARGDHFIKIDFTGWKYFELVEIESSEFSNYIWPDSGFYVYDSYRHTVQFNNIDKIQLWYNNLSGGRESGCLIGQIRALPLVPLTITDPSVSIDGKTVVFRCRMESGMYLEFNSEDDCKLYGPKGEFIMDVEINGAVPELMPGENEMSFKCNGPANVNPRVQVTVITEGLPLM